jgi:hypothetical protein
MNKKEERVMERKKQMKEKYRQVKQNTMFMQSRQTQRKTEQLL